MKPPGLWRKPSTRFLVAQGCQHSALPARYIQQFNSYFAVTVQIGGGDQAERLDSERHGSLHQLQAKRYFPRAARTRDDEQRPRCSRKQARQEKGWRAKNLRHSQFLLSNSTPGILGLREAAAFPPAALVQPPVTFQANKRQPAAEASTLPWHGLSAGVRQGRSEASF